MPTDATVYRVCLSRKFIEIITLALMVCFVTPAAAEDDKRSGVRLDWFVLRETLPSGHVYVKESGARLEGFVAISRDIWDNSEFTYRGAVYGTLVRHRGDDPTRFAIPAGTEDTLGGQVGTRHLAALWTPILIRDRLQVGPVATAGFDVWYRPLSYYEIWQVPSGSLGIRVKSKSTDSPFLIEAGVRRSIDAKVRTQTTHAPWNATSNTTLLLGDRNNFYGSVVMNLKSGWEIGLYYEEQKYGASSVHLLSNGNTIFQPQTTIRQVGISGSYRF